MEIPLTAHEIRLKVQLMFGHREPLMTIKHTVVQLNDQFKIVGSFTKDSHISTFTLEMNTNVPRQFIDEDLHGVIQTMKKSFLHFLESSHKYTTPFHQHIQNTVFYHLNQVHFRVLETITQIRQSYPNIVNQLLIPTTIQSPAIASSTYSSYYPQAQTPLPNYPDSQQQQDHMDTRHDRLNKRKRFKPTPSAPRL